MKWMVLECHLATTHRFHTSSCLPTHPPPFQKLPLPSDSPLRETRPARRAPPKGRSRPSWRRNITTPLDYIQTQMWRENSKDSLNSWSKIPAGKSSMMLCCKWWLSCQWRYFSSIEIIQTDKWKECIVLMLDSFGECEEEC